MVNARGPASWAWVLTAWRGGRERREWDYRLIDIVAVIEREGGIRLRPKTRRGEYCGRCPFPDCSSREDGFLVWDRIALEERADGSREKHFWCRRCGRSGNVVSFLVQLAEARGQPLSWREAARRAGLLSREGQEGEENKGERSPRRGQEDEEFRALLAVYERARKALVEGADEQGRAYLAWRGIDLEVARQQGIGYIPAGKGEGETSELRRRWQGRILFPLYDWKGDITGLKGRTIAFWQRCASPLEQRRQIEEWNRGHPGSTLAPYLACGSGTFGTPDIREAETLICCEGEFDALAFLSAGLGPVRATGKHPAQRLPLTVTRVILAVDRDVTEEELIREARALRQSGLELEMVRPPAPYKDFADVWAARQQRPPERPASAPVSLAAPPGGEREPEQEVRPCEAHPTGGDPLPELPPWLMKLATSWPGEDLDIEIEYNGQVVWRQEGSKRGDLAAPGGTPLEKKGRRCVRHDRRALYWTRDGQGYCADPDCYSRVRLFEAGRRLRWPELRQDIPPNGRFPGWCRLLVLAGEAHWQRFVAEAPYELVDAALREAGRRGQGLPLLTEVFEEGARPS